MAGKDQRSDDQTTRYLFGPVTPWWTRRTWLRLLNYVPLRSVDRSYAKWRRARISPRRLRKTQERLDRQYPPAKYSAKNLIGREKELNLLLDSFRLHVLKHPMLRGWFKNDELPKAICLTGESGTGKTFLTMVSLKQMLLEAHKSGLFVSPLVIRGSDVYSEFYGRSTRQLSKILDQASASPSVVYIDEFQTFGRKVRGETGTELEDTRVQDELNRWLDKVTTGNSRTMVIVATNAYEQTREDIRRRMTRIDLDSGITRDMLLAIIEDSLGKQDWSGISPIEVLAILEREASIRRKGSITPNDILGIFREVRKAKEIPLLQSLRRSIPGGFSRFQRPKYKVTLDDFAKAARGMKLYTDQERTREISDAVYLVKPKETRNDVGGLDDVKNRILNHIALTFSPKMKELGFNSNCRFLLLGPPGTGKTLLALVAAGENNVNFIRVRGGELMSGASYVGEPERRIRELFGLARQKSPCILFLDEADAIFWGPDPASNRVLAQVKAELSELRPEDRIVVIATSNREQYIDQATRDRFEPNIYYVHPPLTDAEWCEVVEVHLRKITSPMHTEVTAKAVTKMLRQERIVSPRGAAEVIAEAHRLWASELTAYFELQRASQDAEKELVQEKYADDLKRLHENIRRYHPGQEIMKFERSVEDYPIRLVHFETAIGFLETIESKQRRELEEAFIPEKPLTGLVTALYASGDGGGGLLTIQCVVRPAIPGEKHVSLTGQASAAVLGQVSIPDESVLHSAENAAEAVRSWLWQTVGIDLGNMHVHYQVRSLMEGAAGRGVSGPSAGLAFFFALVSELSRIALNSTTVMTGTIGLKLDVGPVGGLGGFGHEAGKIVGILKAQSAQVRKLVVSASNYRFSKDEFRILKDEGIEVIPVSSVVEAWKAVLRIEESDLLEQIRGSVCGHSRQPIPLTTTQSK